jgi:MYXO-CTERM domain-containing protein
MLRSRWWLAVAALLGVSGAASAEAQACDSDDGCPTGQYCSFGDGAVSDAPCREGEECEAPEPVTGQCEALPTGYCETQSDCAVGLECAKEPSVIPCAGPDVGAPPPGGEQPADTLPPECEETDPTPSRYGVCVLPVTPCQTDDQCLAGLSCVTRDEDVPTDGGSGGGTDPEPLPEPTQPTTTKDGTGDGICAYAPQPCGDGETCGAGYVCESIVTSEWCSGGAPACDPAAPDCEPVEPTEPECGETRESFCLPAKDPCSTDADCAPDWRCVEFTNAEGGLETPESWNETGSIKSCLPEGLALVAASGNGGGGIVDRDEASGPDVGSGGLGEDGDGTSAPTEDSASKDADGDSEASLCSVKHGAGQSSGAMLALAALTGLLTQRRRRRQG